MTEQELREKIQEWLRLNTREGDCSCLVHQKWVKESSESLCALAIESLPELAKANGYVRLAEDQSLPLELNGKVIIRRIDHSSNTFNNGQRSLIDNDWRRVIL